jgi:hypothetical protein
VNPSLIFACLWALVAGAIGMLPSRDGHWRAAWGLAAVGVPLVGWVTWANGPFVGMIVLAAGVSVLRWPLWYLWRRVTGRRLTGKE